MPLVKDEQEVKKTSQFLKYEVGDGGNNLILKSHLYKITTHYLNSVKRSVECREEECLYCAANYQKRHEYNYFAYLNGLDGFLDVKPSVFFAIQSIAKAQRKDVRQISWTIIKKGDGLNTDYTTSKDDNLTEVDYKNLMGDIDVNTQKLVAAMERRENDLATNYLAYTNEIREQAEPKKSKVVPSAKVKDEVDVEELPEPVVKMMVQPGEPDHVTPDDVPF